MKSYRLWGICMLAALGLSACGVPADTGSASAQTRTAAEASAQIPSLHDTYQTAFPLYADGTQLSVLQVEGSALVSVEDLAQAFSWLGWQEEDGELTLLRDNMDVRTFQATTDDKSGDFTDTALEVEAADGEICEHWLEINALADALSLRCLYDEENQTYYLSEKIDTAAIPTGAHVPVLMYHAVSDDTWGLEGLFLSPAEMEEQLQYLTENGYDPIFFSDLSHLADYDKPVLLTFDDGYDNNYTELYPLLEKYQVKATIFVIPSAVGKEHFMTAEQIKELSDSGLVSIQSHTQDHQELASLSAAEQRQQLEQSQLSIARLTGRVPSVLSYPSGSYSDTTLGIAPEYYDVAVKSRGNLWIVQDNFFEVDRYPVYRGCGMAAFRAFVH